MPMPKYFFHLLGDVSAHDLIGHECTGDKEAQKYGKMLSHNVGTDRLAMIKGSNYISVVNTNGRELFKISLSSLSA
jgi:hypothetical protein